MNNLIPLMGSIARHLYGEPNKELSSKGELRFGTHGSLSIDLVKGTWFDHETNEGGGVIDLIKRAKGFHEPKDCFAWMETEGYWENGRAKGNGKDGGLGIAIAHYNYTNERGDLVFQVVRFDPKSFRQRRPNGNDGWIWNIKDVEQVPYCLPELTEAIAGEHIVVVVEGEKDADALWRIGVPASCNAMGAGKWKPALNKYFAGADVVLIPDNDDAGFKHVQQVGTELTAIAKCIRVLMLPNLPPKGDASDWLAAGGTREQLDELIAGAPEFVRQEAPATDSDAKAKADARDQELIDRLAQLGPSEYERERRDVARAQNWRASALDDMVNARRNARDAERGPAPLFGDWVVEPWDSSVATDVLILAIMARIKRNVVMSDDQRLAVTLWNLLAWVHDAVAVHSPMLLITAPEKDSGKSTLAGLLRHLTPRAMLTVGISEAALFRGIEKWRPTVIISEADTILKYNEPLRAVINAGWTRGAGVPRCIGDDQEVHVFPVFCPRIIDMKGRKLPGTTLSRCVIIEMKRQRSDEKAEHFKQIDDDGLAQLRRMLLRWAMDTESALSSANPKLPPGFDNRLGDNWRLLFAIGDLAGREWGDKARVAAARLNEIEDTTSIGVRLLTAIKAIFESDDQHKRDEQLSLGVLKPEPVAFIKTADLIEQLTGDDTSEFKEWGRSGKPITGTQLARLLKPYRIFPRPDTKGEARGYHKGDFADSWERYISLGFLPH